MSGFRVEAEFALEFQNGLRNAKNFVIKLRLAGGKVTVTDGPFTETKEVIGGFAILNYASHDEAIAGARRVMQIHAECGVTELEMELRPMMEDLACGAQVPQQASAA